MLNTVLKWGGISGFIMVFVIVVGNLLIDGTSPENYKISEILGYTTMIVCLGVIYLALNETRDTRVTIWQKIVLGVGISAVAGAMFGVYNVIHVTYIDPDFIDNYFDYFISQLPTQSGPEFEAQLAELTSQKEMFSSTIMQFFVMGSTVLLVGIPESIILAVLHKKLDRDKTTM